MNFTQEPRQFMVGSGNGRAAVDDEENERRLLDRNLRLLEDALRDFSFFAGNDAAGVHNVKGAAIPAGCSVDAVASDSRLIGDD